MTPGDRKYSKEHTWALADGDLIRVGITAHAVSELGEIVALELPAAGSNAVQSRTCGAVESMKTVSDLIAPVSGTVTERNEAALSDPSLVNSDPYGAGWLFRVRPSDGSGIDQLMGSAEYEAGI